MFASSCNWVRKCLVDRKGALWEVKQVAREGSAGSLLPSGSTPSGNSSRHFSGKTQKHVFFLLMKEEEEDGVV